MPRHLHRGANRILVLVLGVGLLPGCQGSASTRGAGAVRDSLTVRIVGSNRPRLDAERRWIIDSIPALVIRSDTAGDGADLFAVRGVIRLDQGQIVVANAGSMQLRIYDESGQIIRMVGRMGSGPGEFTEMWDLFRCTGDTIVVAEGRRVSLFTSVGDYARTQRIPGPPGARAYALRGVSRDCASLLLTVQEDTPPSDDVYYPQESLVWSSLAHSDWDTVARVPGPARKGFRTLGQFLGLTVPFGRFPVLATDGERIYTALTDKFEVRVLGRNGLSRIVRWRGLPTPFSDADRNAYDVLRNEIIQRSPSEAAVIPPLERFPVPSTRPFFSRLLLDDEGNLWIREYPQSMGGFPRNRPEEGDPPEMWTVIDSTGTWLGEVRMPGGLDVKSIQGGRVYGVVVTRDGLEQVNAHPIHRP